MLQVFLVVVMVLQLQHYSVVRCRTLSIVNTEVQMPTTHNVPQCKDDAKSTENPGIDFTGIKINPAGGTGIFRDPLEVLGTLFPTSKSINICELWITLQADVASRIQFSERGRRVCTDVCRQYQKNMITSGPVDVTLLHGFCDYSNSADTIDNTDLATTCTCAYRVACDNKTTMVIYSFQANSQGHLKVSMSEPSKPQPIT